MTARPVLYVHANGKVSRRLPLPWRTRLRLRARRRIAPQAFCRIDTVGCFRAPVYASNAPTRPVHASACARCTS